MPATSDFRRYVFSARRVDASGKDIGRRVYWKLYAIENLFRVIVHSILRLQIGPDWWDVAVDPAIKGSVRSIKAQYAKRPLHSMPGRHEVYYTFLSGLSKIITANSHLFRPIIPDIDQWIERIERVRLPRNIVGHMNWPHKADRRLIDDLHCDLHQLVQRLAQRLAASGTNLSIP